MALLALIVVARQATACSYVIQTQLSFESGSAVLNRSQVIKLAEWLHRSYASVPIYVGASIETGASDTSRGKAKALAELRATNTTMPCACCCASTFP